MTVKELLDAINKDRYDDPENGTEKIWIMDDDGDPELETVVSCEILKLIEDREIDSISAEDNDTFGIYLKNKK